MDNQGFGVPHAVFRVIGAPYFVRSSDTTIEKYVSNLTDKFKIFELRTVERVNHLGYATVKATVPSNFLEDTQSSLSSPSSSSIKTSEDFFAAQMLKRVSICMDRPSPDRVPPERFQKKTWFHGVLTKSALEVTSLCDVVTFELRPYFWLLTQQNNYRSFSNMNLDKILESIFQPYKEEFPGVFEIHHNYAKTQNSQTPNSKTTADIVQLIQHGETDFEFVMRIFEKFGLSYFFYHDEKTTHLVITDNLSSEFDKIHQHFSSGPSSDGKAPLSEPLNYRVVTGREHGLLPEGVEMPLEDFRVVYESPLQQLRVQTLPDYRIPQAAAHTLSQENLLATKSSGFKPTQSTFIPTSFLASTKTADREEYLKTTFGTNFLERDFSSKLNYFGHTSSHGFIPMWRKMHVHVHNKDTEATGRYVRLLADEHNFLPCALMHYFSAPPETYFVSPAINSQNSYASFYVEINFFKMGDDTFKPSLEIFHTSARQEKNPSHLFSAVVVKFEDNDKTENDYDVPNAVRVRFPWHKEGESVKARSSFFWTGNGYGSLFLPEEGSEVCVAFLANDPDYPVIMGSFYNANNNYPLAVKKREKDGPIDARGIVFKEDAARFVFETVKEKNDQKTQILTLSTEDGNLAVAASNIDTKAKKSLTTTVLDSKSSLTMDSEKVKLDCFEGQGIIDAQKDQLSLSSNKIALKAKGEIGATAGVINANSLKLPG